MAILIVEWLIGKEELRDFAISMSLNFDMDMGRSHVAAGSRVRSRFDRRQRVATILVSSQEGVSLKIGVEW